MKGMRRLNRAMLVVVVGAILWTASNAQAQATVSGPSAALPAPAATPGVNGPDTPLPAESKTTNGKTVIGGEGYTWHEKSAQSGHRKARAAKVNPNLAQAKGPEFAVVSDGTTRITVQLSKKVIVRTEGSHRRLIVNLEHAQVAVLNDRNPLIMTHFATPVEDARLVPNKDAVRLVIDLKESVTPQVTLRDAAAGASLLEVVLPKSIQKQSTATDRARTKPKARVKSKVSKEPNATPRNGIGPRL